MIEIKGLHKTFNANHVLRGIDLKIETGETMVIIGRSGCGKSVLLKHIIGLIEPDEGSVLIEGKDITKLDRFQLNEIRPKIGMLFQGSALFDSLSVGENVGFSLLERSDVSEEEVAERVAKNLRLVGLSKIQKLEPAQLSGGMKKRVALARAICGEPQIILYDEPTTGLDPIMADVINNLIIRMHNKLNITSIVVTHDMVSAYKVADKIAMLYEGKIVGVGTPDEIKNTSDPVIKQFVTGQAKGPITADKSKFVIEENDNGMNHKEGNNHGQR